PLYRQDNGFHPIGHDAAQGLDVHDFAESPDGWVLMATDSGLWRARGQAFEAVDLGAPASLRAVFHDPGESFAGGRGAIFENTGNGWRRTGLPASFEQATVTAFAAHDGRLWAGTTQGLLVREAGVWQPVRFHPELGERLIEVIYRDRDDTLWIGTSGALFRLAGSRVIDRWGSQGLFRDGNVLSVAEDHEGNLWLGSRSYGVARLWNGYVLRYAGPEGLHEGLTWALARDAGGSLWVGTADGLTRFAEGRFRLQVAGTAQPHPHAYSLLPEPGRVWVGTRAGLYWWLPDDARMVTPQAFDALAGSEIRAILPHAGDYWIGASSGIWRWDGTRLECVLPASEDSAHQTRVLLETRDGRLLAGTQGGILEYQPRRGFTALPGMPGRPDILSLLELADGRLLAGNRSEHLLVRQAGQWRVLGEAQGIPANAVYAMAEFDGQVWAGGNRGLYRLDLDRLNRFLDGEAATVDAEMILSERGDIPGAQATPCCNGAGNARVAFGDGALWFASRDGIVAIEPGRIRRNPIPPPLQIDRVRKGGHWQLLEGRSAVVLPPQQRDIDIGFAALSFRDPGSVQLAYRMLGFQDKWQRLDSASARVAFYTNL
ncbi:MAG: two-component regulator propeller domain-containing protein, partial [Chromatocurvus sp.]